MKYSIQLLYSALLGNTAIFKLAADNNFVYQLLIQTFNTFMLGAQQIMDHINVLQSLVARCSGGIGSSPFCNSIRVD